jgi:mycoredoxin-dependent peroxiredoxin
MLWLSSTHLSFSGICTGELCELRDNFGQFENSDVELLAVSVDSKFVQKKFADEEGYKFSVLADFWPHGAVARDYGVFLEDSGMGEVAAKFETSPGEPRKLSDYKNALELV